MASDLSNIIKEELANTLEQLLSKKTSIESTSKTDINEYKTTQAIKIEVKLEFKTLVSTWNFFIPTLSATKFEYFMLGGMGEIKEYIDDEIADAVKEIISNICGSITTSVNAQGYEDLGTVKFELTSNEIVLGETLKESEGIYTIFVNMENDVLPVLIEFDKLVLPYIYGISGVKAQESKKSQNTNGSSVSGASINKAVSNGDVSEFSSLLGENSVANLKLLFDIKLKLSVRLGSKNFLLKDILRWDIGEIIELEQMVNEPLEILVNGVKVGEGEAVVVEGKFGLKIKKIGNEQSRLLHIGLGK